MKEIGSRIKKLRTDSNLTMKQLAKKIGISESTVCCYEYNKRIPKDDIKVKLAKFFNVTVEELFYK